MSYEIWEKWKETMSTIWDANWDNYSAADHYVMKN